MEVRKILGQAAPAATTETDLYVVPNDKGAVISSIIVCNRAGHNRSYRIIISPSGIGTENKNYIAYDRGMGANEVHEIKCGITLSGTDEIRVYASDVDLSFNCFGAEFDQLNLTIP